MSGGTGETMTSRRAQIARMRRVAVAALDRYALPDGRLTFVTHGENTTFRHDSAAGRYLVRVHRPQRHGRDVDSSAAIRSEIAWLGAIRAGHRPVGPGGARGHRRRHDRRGDRGRADPGLLGAPLDGRAHHEGSARPVHLRRLGAAMARLHHQADAWTPPPDFVRIRWDHETFFGDVMVYGETSAAGCWALLPAEVRARFESVAARMGDLSRTSTTSGSSTPTCTSATRCSSAARSS